MPKYPNHRKAYGCLDNTALIHNLLNEYQNYYYDFLDADEFLQYCSLQMPQFVDYVEQNTILQDKDDLWHDMRLGRITASIIYEVSKCRKPNGHLVQQILGRTRPAPETQPMKRGIDLQKEVIDVVSNELNTPLSICGLFLDSKHPVLGASPDAVGPNFVVEVKCPVSEENFKNYVHPDKKNYLKAKFYAQIQLQMHLKKVQYGYFVIAHPDFETTKKVDIIKVDYNQQFIERTIEDAMKFWKANIYPEILYDIVQ